MAGLDPLDNLLVIAEPPVRVEPPGGTGLGVGQDLLDRGGAVGGDRGLDDDLVRAGESGSMNVVGRTVSCLPA